MSNKRMKFPIIIKRPNTFATDLHVDVFAP